jgi:hypothetical protein
MDKKQKSNVGTILANMGKNFFKGLLDPRVPRLREDGDDKH